MGKRLWLNCPDEFQEQQELDEREYRRRLQHQANDHARLTCGGVEVNYIVKDGRIVFT